MSELKNVGVRQFRDHATRYLSGPDPIAVSKHGRIVGFYVPLQRDQDEVSTAVTRLGETVAHIPSQSALSEEDLAGLFDLRVQHPG